MPEGASFSISIKDLKKSLNKLEASVKDDVIKDSLYSGGVSIVAWARANRLRGPRPRFLDRRSGMLHQTLNSSKTEKEGNAYFVKIGTAQKSKSGFSYPAYWEGVFPFDGARRIKPRPFIKPAIEDKDNRKFILDTLRENIEKAFKK